MDIKKTNIHQGVKNYYGDVLNTKEDLKTGACCPIETAQPFLLPYLDKLDEEVKNKFYGCGSPIPPVLSKKHVLDLGCGTGRDVFLLSQLVGEQGSVLGIDMTEEQLEVANRLTPSHMQRFGYKESNVTFRHGLIENLVGVDDESMDVVVSNCVINLAPNKKQVFEEIRRVLKPGGELYFSDVFTDRRVPSQLTIDPILVGECLGGALYTEDFRRLMADIGFSDIRVMSQGSIELHDKEIVEKAGYIDFQSITVRAFKMNLEDRCENYGHSVVYQGGIEEMPEMFILDKEHEFPKGETIMVCGNTAQMLSTSRYAPYFKLQGDFSSHKGLFSSIEKKSQNTGCC